MHSTGRRHGQERGILFWLSVGDRLTVGLRVLDPPIEVRILIPQPSIASKGVHVPSSNQDDVVIRPKSIKVNLTPYAQAQFVRDLDHAIESINTEERFSAAKFFLICLSIELSIKSCLLAAGLSNEDCRRLGHNLDELSKTFKEKVDGELLTNDDTDNLSKAVLFYDRDGAHSKGVVYFENNMKEQALKGYKDLPEISSLVVVKDKLHGLLEGND